MSRKQMTYILGIVCGVTAFQEFRFRLYKKRTDEFMGYIARWIDICYQEEVDEKFAEIATEQLPELGDLGEE